MERLLEQQLLSLLGEIKNTQWRPTTNQLRGLLARNTAPYFRGTSTEDPTTFLNQLDNYLDDACIPGEDRLLIAEGLLDYDALEWWSPLKSGSFDYDAFKQLLLDHYDSHTVRSRLRAELYGTNQAFGQSSVQFISRKAGLAARVMTRPIDADIATDDHLVPFITKMMRPKMRKHLQRAAIKTVDDLILQAVQLEAGMNFQPILSAEDDVVPRRPPAWTALVAQRPELEYVYRLKPTAAAMLKAYSEDADVRQMPLQPHCSNHLRRFQLSARPTFIQRLRRLPSLPTLRF
jgi:hypothetical protein